MITQEFYKAGIYCRLSNDDGSQGDSSSIQTQKLILEKFCKENNFIVYDVYSDDGYSGLNFNRPAFQRLLKDIEDKKINLIITKDLSRLGRDYIQTGYYSEVYFQSKGVRYIAINDNVDTLRNENEIAPFKNILNDMYAKDLSKKVKSAKRQRALNGMFISAQTAFGYKKNPLNPNQLVIDEEAAITVKLIFKLFLEGKGIVAIRKHLAENRFITPAAYKARNGETRFDRFLDLRGDNWEYNWCQETISLILKDMVYVGDMENRKHEVENYKTKRRVKVAKENHIIVQNTHEPIISRSDFERIQELRSSKRRPQKQDYENIFKGLIICKECNHRMHITNQIRKTGKDWIFYKCSYHVTNPDKCKVYNYMNYNALKEIVSQRIRTFFEAMKNKDSLLELISKSRKENDLSVKYEQEKSKIEKKLDALVKMTLKIYQDFVTEIIDEKTYYQLINECQTEKKVLTERLVEVNKLLEKTAGYNQGIAELKEAVNEFLDFKELSREMVCKLISKIVIEPPRKENNQKKQEITIIYRFIELAL